MSKSGTQFSQWQNSWGIDALIIGALFGIGLIGIILSGKPAPAPVLELAEANIEAPVSILPDFKLRTRPEIVPQVPAETADNEILDAPETLTADNGTAFITLMGGALNDNVWYVSTHENKDNFYGVDWKRENVAFSSNGTALSIKRDNTTERAYSASEIRTHNEYGFGTYEAMMRPARGSGTVSAFFTYTGGYMDDPHDEIDFEFLGGDLTKIHLNYWRDGKRGDHRIVDLGFDAGEAPHLYTIDWREDGITWKIDGRIIHQTEPGDPVIPQAFGKLYFSIWTGSGQTHLWHGERTFEDGAQSEISCVSFVPEGGEGRACSSFYLKRPIRIAQATRP